MSCKKGLIIDIFLKYCLKGERFKSNYLFFSIKEVKNTPSILGDFGGNNMVHELWLPQADVDKIADQNNAWIKRQQEVSYICPAMIEPTALWGAHLGMFPADLEKTIIETVTSTPELLEKIEGVNIHYNPDAYHPKQAKGSLNFLLVAYSGEGPFFCENKTKLTTALLKALNLKDEFRPYMVNFLAEELAKKMGTENKEPIEKITYQTQMLTLHPKG